MERLQQFLDGLQADFPDAYRLTIPNYRGFALAEEIRGDRLCEGGIFTRQCLEFIHDHQKGRIPDLIIIFSDSQDCDLDTSKKPNPFGSKNYIIDVSAHQHALTMQEFGLRRYQDGVSIS